VRQRVLRAKFLAVFSFRLVFSEIADVIDLIEVSEI